MMDDKTKVTRIKVEVDMSRVIQHIEDSFKQFSQGLSVIIANMVEHMQIPPEARARTCDVILARALLIYADAAAGCAAAGLAEEAQKTLEDVIKVKGRMH